MEFFDPGAIETLVKQCEMAILLDELRTCSLEGESGSLSTIDYYARCLDGTVL